MDLKPIGVFSISAARPMTDPWSGLGGGSRDYLSYVDWSSQNDLTLFFEQLQKQPWLFISSDRLPCSLPLWYLWLFWCSTTLVHSVLLLRRPPCRLDSEPLPTMSTGYVLIFLECIFHWNDLSIL